jgi:hypothetical protein
MGPRSRPLIGLLVDFDLAQEAAQEAFAIAADRWPQCVWVRIADDLERLVTYEGPIV